MLTDATLVETSNTSLGKTVGEREILDLPLNGRNFTQLGLLQPGVVPITPGLQKAGGSLRDGEAYSVNGQRPESNNFLIDGANNFNSVDGGLVIQLPIDSIAEFRILTHTANAEFRHSTGSTTNIITRSGTNSYHGALWECTLADSWSTRSSARFKTNIHPLTGAVATVEKLRGVSYDLKATGKHDIGLIAEEVAQVVPEIVSFDPTTGQALGLDYARLTALLIEAVKQQQRVARQQHAQIRKLQSEAKRLHTQLNGQSAH